MSFVKKEVNRTPIEDNVFAIVKLAKAAKDQVGAENVVDATIGSLYDEYGTLVAFDSVFTPYDKIDKKVKAKYAGSFVGNEDFRQQVYNWIVKPSGCSLKHSVIATPGGSGAVAMTISEILDEHETLILPEIAWGSYQLMATMDNIETMKYSLFDGDGFNLESFKQACRACMDKQQKVCAIINDPCHNPTGYSMSHDEWKAVIEFVNELSKEGPVILLNDIAYIDFSYDLAHSRDYMKVFDNISDNVFVIVAFSTSKSLTSYGLRCGAAILLAQTQEAVREVEIVFEKTARATWSNIPNAAMDNFTYVTTTGLDAYMEEKAYYVDLLKQRSDIFTAEADACGLTYYPYKEGFFVTLKVEDNAFRDAYHQKLMDQHIYTVKVNKGIRVAVCSLSVEKCKGLAQRMKDILDQM